MTTELIGQKPTFTALPNWLRGKATPLEGWILWCLQSHYPNIHPSMTLLAQEACISRRSVSAILAGMERKGWLVRERAFSEQGRKLSNRYRLTIWDPHWAIPDRATDALGQEMHHSTRAGDALGIGQDVHMDRAGDALGIGQEMPIKKNKRSRSREEDQEKKENPPLPPKGQRRDKRDDTHPYRDRDGFVVNPDRQPQATEAQPQPTQPVKPWESPQQPKPETPPEPQQALATVPVDPQPKSRKAGFTPTEGNVPAALLPVVSELLEFWASKGGKKTERAWTAQLGQLNQIQADPTGGTEAARAQLLAGVQAATFGKAWCAVTYTNWQRYGRSRTPIGGTGFNRRMTQDEHAAEASAFIRERDARRAAEAARAAQEAQGTLILAEVV